MWDVVLADGRCKDSETDMLHQIEAALEITPEDSQALQEAAIGNGREKA